MATAQPASAAPPPRLPPAPTSPRQTGPYGRVVLVGVLAVLVAAVLDLLLAKPTAAAAPAGTAGVLAAAGSLAVAIERLMQLFWTFVDQSARNPSYPFSGDAVRLQRFATQLGAIVGPALDQAEATLQALDQQAVHQPATVADVRSEIAALRGALEAVANAGDPGAAGGPPAIGTGLDRLAALFATPSTRASVGAASAAVSGVAQLVGSTTDNPGRRMMSLFAGAVLGLIAAGVLGLDAVHAALGTPSPRVAWGLVATGLAIGLGSNPVHELIQAVQAYKQSQQ